MTLRLNFSQGDVVLHEKFGLVTVIQGQEGDAYRQVFVKLGNGKTLYVNKWNLELVSYYG
jgi:hypothetical protein